MSVLINQVRQGFYLDSVALMRLSQQLSALPAVDTAALMIGSASNKQILASAELLNHDGEHASGNDLIIAMRLYESAEREAVLEQADVLLQRPAASNQNNSDWQPKSLRAALTVQIDANLALISVPGEYAVAEAWRALQHDLHVMLFSDNISLVDECALKQAARERGLLMMGPDCGTALIAGTALAFANAIPRGDIGIIAASGTGLQEVSCLIARAGRGVSHGIGVGGRDLSDAVGGITTLQAIDALEADPASEHIVLISKPPGQAVVEKIMQRIGQSSKSFSVCFLGMEQLSLPPNAKQANNLQATAELALGVSLPQTAPPDIQITAERRWIRGLYCGGTLCAEAQVILRASGQLVYSNVPISGVDRLHADDQQAHTLIDLGADEYTLGRPHPMLDPSVRDEQLAGVLQDPNVALVLVDIVLGYGAHAEPSKTLIETLAAVDEGPLVIASVCGTDDDPQHYSRQVSALRAAGVWVCESNAQAAQLACRLIT